MKVLDPTNTTHIITLQPRFNPSTDLELELTDKVSKVVNVVSNTYVYLNGVLNISFDLEVLEGEQYYIEITETNKVIFRGSIFCTSQEPQYYKLTANKFEYV